MAPDFAPMFVYAYLLTTPFVPAAVYWESGSAANASVPGSCNAYSVDDMRFDAVRVAARQQPSPDRGLM